MPRRDPAKPMTEAALEHYFQRRVHALGGVALKVMPTIAGAPDRLIMMPGSIVRLVELKTERGKVSPIQFHFHERLRVMGIPVAVLYGRAEVDDWLKRLVDACGPQIGRGKRANPATVQPRTSEQIEADRQALL